jgi:endonuclease/exonuclease/phosphatase family metal-dependent hydrolase
MRLMTWNVENLFRPGGPAGVTTQPAYEQKLNNVASLIVQHDPDVVALQEIGDPLALDDLVAAGLSDYSHITVSTHPDPAPTHPIRVAFLSKSAPSLVQELVDLPGGGITSVAQEGSTLDRLGRGALAITLTLDGAPTRLISIHLKSKLLSYPGGRFSPHDENERALAGGYALFRRAAEAVAIRVWADQLLTDSQTALVVMGDLNDGPEAATTQILYGPPDRDLQRKDKGDAWRLVNLARFLPADNRFSRTYLGEPELLDHILTTTELARRQVSILTDTTHVTAIGDQPSDRKTAVWPDHAPVMASLV